MIAADLRRYADRLRLVLSRRALRGVAGARTGTAAGSSLEFHDYRDYHPGDDVRLITWNDGGACYASGTAGGVGYLAAADRPFVTKSILP